MDFKTVLNIKPFVPANPPPLPPSLPPSPPPALETIQEAPEEEAKLSTETQGRKRRRRRNNTVRRKKSAVEKDAAHDSSQSSLITPPNSNPHTPLKTGFNSESQLGEPPILRLLEATPVLPPFPMQEPMGKIPAKILHAVAYRARERLATRIQMGWEEQQQVIGAAMRIQEAYSMHIEAQLEKSVLDLKKYLEKEVEKKIAEHEAKWRKEMEKKINQATQPSKKKKKDSVMDDEAMSAAVSQLHAHCKQICTVFSGLQISQLETVDSVREVRSVLESIGLLVPRFPQGVLHPVPVLGGMPPNVHPTAPQPFASMVPVSIPPFPVNNNNSRIPSIPNMASNLTAKAPNAKVKPTSTVNASVMTRSVLVEGNQGSTAQPNYARVDKENESIALQPPTSQMADGRTDSLRL